MNLQPIQQGSPNDMDFVQLPSPTQGTPSNRHTKFNGVHKKMLLKSPALMVYLRRVRHAQVGEGYKPHISWDFACLMLGKKVDPSAPNTL